MSIPARVLVLSHRDGTPSGPAEYLSGLRASLDPESFSITATDTANPETALKKTRPHIVFGAPVYDLQLLHTMVPYYPHIAFALRTLTHWSVSQAYHELPIVLAWLKAVARFPNAYICANSAIGRDSMPPGPRVLFAPNVYPYPPLPPLAASPNPVRLALISRPSWSKQFPVAILACRILARRMAIELHVWSKSTPDAARHMRELNWTNQLPGQVVWHPYAPNASALRSQLRAVGVSAVLMPTLSESYGYAGADAISAGIPVAGTAALPYLHSPWQCPHPTDPSAFADTAARAITATPEEMAQAQATLALHTAKARAATTHAFAVLAAHTAPEARDVDARNWTFQRRHRSGRLR